MSTLVNAVLWEPDVAAPLNIEPWAMYEVPQVGEHYWHHRTGYTVREIAGELTPPELHVVRDRAWEDEVRDGLPEAYILEGRRRDDDGMWRFDVLSPTTGLPLGAGGSSPDFGAAAHEAIAIGQQHHAARA